MLVIGLDAADRQLIEQWADAGRLPNIARLRAEGVWGSLATTADTVHVSAWPSIFSGVTPDEHGLYHAYVMQEGVQEPVRPRPEDCPVPFLWKLLDEQGKKSIVMDAFLTCPLRDFSGIQIVDWGSWTWFFGQDIRPASIKEEIRRKFGNYPAEDHSKVGMTPPADPVGFYNRLMKGVEKKTEVAKWLMESQSWDFFLLVFGECHAAGHYFWHYQDPDYIAYPEHCDPALRTAMQDIYIALDRSIGELLEQADDDTTVMVVSGDGMGPNYSGSHLLAELLKRMQLMNAGDRVPAEQSQSTSGKRSFSSVLRGLIPKQLRAVISRYVLPRSFSERLSLHWQTADIEWSRTRAFVIENANEGYIRINLKDREPEGIVEKSGEYDRLCESLLKVTRSLSNPANGKSAVTHVHKTVDLYSGPCVRNMPDIIINWDPDAEVTTDLHTKQLGTVSCPHAAYEVSPYYSGNHRGNAFVAAAGPEIHARNVLSGASILDLAPTILTFFHIPVPDYMDGAVRSSLLNCRPNPRPADRFTGTDTRAE